MNSTSFWQLLRELPGFIACMAAIVVIGVFSELSLLDALDNHYYDFVVDTIPQPSSTEHAVLLLETQPGVGYDWESLTTGMLQAGALQLVFVAPLSPAELVTLAQSTHAAKLLIGRGFDTNEMPGRQKLAPFPDEVVAKLATGVVAVPAAKSGFHRTQFAAYRIGPRLVPSVERLAAVAAGKPDLEKNFLLSFHQGYELPRIRAERLQREAPLASLFKGKTVLVGYASAPWLAQYNAPGLSPGRLLSQLEFHGLALDTLLMDRAVTVVGSVAKVVLMLLFGLMLIFVCQPLRLSSAFWVVLSLLICLAGLAWLALRFANLWLPVPELSLISMAVFLLVYRAKARTDDLHLQTLFRESSAKLENRLMPTSFAESQEHWIYIVNLVDQVLQLERTIFLERVPSDHRVKEMQALRCSINDIDEMRRDYHRFPYTEAFARGGALEIDTRKRPYLKVKSAEERQFLVPLMFGGEAFGFWAFAIHPDKIGDLEQFRSMTDTIAEQVGHLLYQRQLWHKRHTAENQPWRRYLDDDSLHLYAKVSRAITALERRMTSLEQMFAGLSNAAIVFDLFGRVVLINELMSHLLSAAEIAPFEMTVADFIERLTGHHHDEVRKTMQVLLADTTPLLLPAILPGKNPGRFVLYVRSLRKDTEVVDEVLPFRINGLLLELIDGAELQRLYGIKTELVSHLNHQLKNDLTTILGAAKLMHAVPAMREKMLGNIETQARAAAATIAQVHDLLAQEIQIDFTGSFPIDMRAPLHHAVERLRDTAAEREIRFDLQMQTTPCPMYVNPREIDETLVSLLNFLLDDAVEGSHIQIHVKVFSALAEFRLSNQGFGMPQERLDRILANAAVSDSTSFEKLRLAQRRIATWGGKLDLHTELGKGYVCAIQLRTFA